MVAKPDQPGESDADVKLELDVFQNDDMDPSYASTAAKCLAVDCSKSTTLQCCDVVSK